MIKLKKFVNVKELYKLGFKRTGDIHILYKEVNITYHKYNVYYINIKTGYIEILESNSGFEYVKSILLDNTLYELFKADLLEVRDD